ISRHRERRQDAHRFAGLEAVHAGAERLDDACCLVAEARGWLRPLHVAAAAERHLRPLQSDGLDAHPDLAFAWIAHLERSEAQVLGAAEFVEADGGGFHAAESSFKSAPTGPVFAQTFHQAKSSHTPRHGASRSE